MICEHCKEETGVGASHAYNSSSGEWLCPSLPPAERQPWVAVRLLQDEVKRLNLQISELKAHSKRVGGVNQVRWNDYVKATERADAAERLNGELAETKGNLLDFILSVRLWATGQPTGMSIKESCDKMLDHYSVKRDLSSPICFWCRETISGEPYKDKFGRSACMSHKRLIEAMDHPVRD